ncbi:MAG: hypothetical protein M0Z62_00085 [Actinomycetota bacterium]|nr:hypothetical protein [Actinomycetota bacterium]MDA8075461.1 hypothetical protein [Actinomycetota bacterium]MDA8365342.1 hypothetical protein [Actinomycetota bacterium]
MIDAAAMSISSLSVVARTNANRLRPVRIAQPAARSATSTPRPVPKLAGADH